MDTTWLKSAQENFREAKEKKNWSLCRAIAYDVAFQGYGAESRAMNDDIDESAPSFAHGYVVSFLRKKNEEYKAKGLVPTLDLLIEDLTN